MKPDPNKSAPTAVPETAEDAPFNPGILLRAFVAVFTEPHVPREQRETARDLDWVLMVDPSAVDDILDALFPGRMPDVLTSAGMSLMFDGLIRGGAFETLRDTVAPAEIRVLTFRARALLDLLRAMPHRHASLGIRHELLDDCTEETETEN